VLCNVDDGRNGNLYRNDVLNCYYSIRFYDVYKVYTLRIVPNAGSNTHKHRNSRALEHIYSTPRYSEMSVSKVRRLNRIVGSNATYLICDIQERFRHLIHQMDAVINQAVLVNKACNVLSIPCIITEHYPKAFGKTVPEIAHYPGTKLFEKKQFSMITPDVAAALKESGRNQVCSLDRALPLCALL
jgi:hypothetical protein